MADSSIAVPEPYTDASCQELIWNGCSHSGWLRKRTRLAQGLSKTKFNILAKFQKKFIPWLHKYVVLSQGCVYCFNNERAKSPSSAFSLYGFTSVTRAGPEICKEEATWVFKLIHACKKRTFWFSASSEIEMKTWMKKIRKEIKNASCLLHKNERSKSSTSGDSDDDSDDDYSKIEAPVVNAILAKKIAERARKTKEIEETSGDEEEQYMAMEDVEAAIEGHRHVPNKAKAKVPQPPNPDHENDDLLDLPKGCPPPPPRKVKLRASLSDDEGKEEEVIYDDHSVSSTPVSPTDRLPPPIPSDQGNEPQLPYDDVEIKQPVLAPNRTKAGKSPRPPPVSPTNDPSQPTFPKKKDLPPLPHEKAMGGGGVHGSARPPVASKPFIPAGAVSVMPAVTGHTSQTLPANRPNPVPRTKKKAATLPTVPDIASSHDDEDVYEDADGIDEYEMAYFDSSSTEEGSRTLIETKEKGSYMVRPSHEQGRNNLTLVVLVDLNRTKKYRIEQKQDSKFYLQREKGFESILHLLQYYQKKNLPTGSMTLGRPYKLVQDDD